MDETPEADGLPLPGDRGNRNNGSGEAYIRFTHGLNLSGDETHDGYNSLSLRVRFDNEEPYWLKARQPWGSDQLSLKKWGDPRLRDAILGGNGNTMLVEIPWYGEGNVIFAFSLAGSRRAFDTQCGPIIAARKARQAEVIERMAREAEAERKDRLARARAALLGGCTYTMDDNYKFVASEPCVRDSVPVRTNEEER